LFSFMPFSVVRASHLLTVTRRKAGQVELSAETP
jgi:hypothetical protein